MAFMFPISRIFVVGWRNGNASVSGEVQQLKILGSIPRLIALFYTYRRSFLIFPYLCRSDSDERHRSST